MPSGYVWEQKSLKVLFEGDIACFRVGQTTAEVYVLQMVQVSFPGTIPGVPVFFPDIFTGSTNI